MRGGSIISRMELVLVAIIGEKTTWNSFKGAKISRQSCTCTTRYSHWFPHSDIDILTKIYCILDNIEKLWNREEKSNTKSVVLILPQDMSDILVSYQIFGFCFYSFLHLEGNSFRALTTKNWRYESHTSNFYLPADLEPSFNLVFLMKIQLFFFSHKYQNQHDNY